MPAMTRRSAMVGLLSFVSCLLLTLTLYGATLNGWWCCDDPQILKHALQHAPWEYFAVPEAWRALVPYSLTPWLSLAYDLDHALFGLQPIGYYAHNLIVIALCAALIGLIVRQWVSGWYAFGGSLLFLVGAPVMVAAHQLMVRHYIDGLLFWLLAFWLLLRAVQDGRSRWGWLAGIGFAVAATAKEIYLPLGLTFFLVPVGSFRQRLVAGWPLLLIMLLYLPWRWYMLGDLVGGYTPATALGRGDLASALAQFANIPTLLLTWPWLPLSGVLLCIGLVIRQTRQVWLLLVLFLPVALLVPLIPLARQPGLGTGSERYFIALWAVLALGTAVLAGSAAAGRSRRFHLFSALVMALLIGSAWHHATAVRVALLPNLQEQFVQGRALVTAERSDVIYLTPAVAPWYLSGIIDLQREFGRQLPPPALVSDEIDLSRHLGPGNRVLRYDTATQTMIDDTAQVRQLLEVWRKKVQPRLLSVLMEFDPQAKTMRWQLGPSSQGQFTLLPEVGQQPLPPQGALRMEKPPDKAFRVRYDAPEGWIAYTPLLKFALTPQGTYRLTMQGPGILPQGSE